MADLKEIGVTQPQLDRFREIVSKYGVGVTPMGGDINGQGEMEIVIWTSPENSAPPIVINTRRLVPHVYACGEITEDSFKRAIYTRDEEHEELVRRAMRASSFDKSNLGKRDTSKISPIPNFKPNDPTRTWENPPAG